ncbi:MAG: hypothetical protein ABH833_00810, partial [Parcubacteria group bacterium]
SQQWEKLQKCFRELQQENPEAESLRVLTWAVAEGRYSALTITRGVNHLVDDGDYCSEVNCTGGCNRPKDKNCLKDWLLHWAYPSVLKMEWLTIEEVRKRRAETNNY